MRYPSSTGGFPLTLRFCEILMTPTPRLFRHTGEILVAVLFFTSAAQADYFTPASTTPTALLTTSVPNPGTRLSTGSGYINTEGPIYYNGSVYFGELSSNHTNDILWRYDTTAQPSNAVSQADPNSGGTQGTTPYIVSGQFVCADRDTRRITVRSFSAPSTVNTANIRTNKNHTGANYNGPNDVAVDSSGGIYFTDPNFENRSDGPGFDGIYYVNTSGTVSLVTNCGSNRPNGIALSPAGDKLYVDLWSTGAINVYSISTSGAISGPTTFVSNLSNPDGITVDRWGNVFVALGGGVNCYSPSYKSGDSPIFTYSDSHGATNVELGGSDGKTLFYTRSGYSSTSYMGLFSIPLTYVPEPASLAILALPAALLLRRRRK
jgi:sugar lactone lactonase YvrE